MKISQIFCFLSAGLYTRRQRTGNFRFVWRNDFESRLLHSLTQTIIHVKQRNQDIFWLVDFESFPIQITQMIIISTTVGKNPLEEMG